MSTKTNKYYYGMPIETTEMIYLGEHYPWFKAKTPIGEFSYHASMNASAVTIILDEHLEKWRDQNANKH